TREEEWGPTLDLQGREAEPPSKSMEVNDGLATSLRSPPRVWTDVHGTGSSVGHLGGHTTLGLAGTISYIVRLQAEPAEYTVSAGPAVWAQGREGSGMPTAVQSGLRGLGRSQRRHGTPYPAAEELIGSRAVGPTTQAVPHKCPGAADHLLGAEALLALSQGQACVGQNRVLCQPSGRGTRSLQSLREAQKLWTWAYRWNYWAEGTLWRIACPARGSPLGNGDCILRWYRGSGIGLVKSR
ncbi:hypothetical protein GOODEAATRI_030327, partial [Goodea atripinnis]